MFNFFTKLFHSIKMTTANGVSLEILNSFPELICKTWRTLIAGDAICVSSIPGWNRNTKVFTKSLLVAARQHVLPLPHQSCARFGFIIQSLLEAIKYQQNLELPPYLINRINNGYVFSWIGSGLLG